ncbi:hypothetical protein JW711_01680 [Candidatus Woesearchaeota archaeon]|nr:hypothetical protein [Candidatus Woesearchaeota archaeon]
MKLTREQIGVAIIFLLILGIRLAYTLPLQSYDNDSYFVLRQADAIAHTGLPLFQDPLSYGGRTFLFPPLFHYVIALFSFFLGLELAAKVVTSLCFALIVIVTYMITKEITKNSTIALISSVFAGFVPVMYFEMASFPTHALSLLLVFLLSYSILKIEDERFAAVGLMISILLLLTSVDIFIFLFGLLFYFLMLFLEKQKPHGREVEMTVFLFLLSLWFFTLLYKKAFLAHGLSILWGNLPQTLLLTYFHEVSFVEVLYAVGVIPLLLGIYAAYHLVFDSKNRDALLFAGFALASFLALWLRLVQLTTGLLFLSVNMIILSSYTMKIASVKVARTKVASLSFLLATAVLILFLLTSVAPFFSTVSYTPQYAEDLEALAWLRENTADNATILGRIEEGFLINYEAKRKNAADSNFLFINNADQVKKDIDSLFRSRLESEAVRLTTAYGVDYVFLSRKTQEQYNITSLFYAEGDCFNLVYEKGALIYASTGCKI